MPSINFRSIEKSEQTTKEVNKTERKSSIASIEKLIEHKPKLESKYKTLFVSCLNSLLQYDNQELISYRSELENKSKNKVSFIKPPKGNKNRPRSNSDFGIRKESH